MSVTHHELAAKATLKFYTQPENLDGIRDEFRRLMREAIKAGDFDTTGMPSQEDYQIEALWAEADAKAGQVTAGVRRRPKNGGTQSVLDYGDDYDQMILVCRGRRTTLGRMTAHDRSLMAQESAWNRKKIDMADDAEQTAATADVLVLQRFADYQSYDEHRKGRQSGSAAS